MDVTELSFDPATLTSEAVEAARQVDWPWFDDLISYVFLKVEGRYFAFLQPHSRQRANFYAVRDDRDFGPAWMMYYIFVRATVFERIPPPLRQVTTIRQFLGPEVIEVYDLYQALRRFIQLCRTIRVSPTSILCAILPSWTEHCTGLCRTPGRHPSASLLPRTSSTTSASLPLRHHTQWRTTVIRRS